MHQMDAVGVAHQRVDTLTFASADVAGHGESLGVVLRVEEVSGRVSHRRDSLVMVVDMEVFSLVGNGGPTVGDGVSRVPGDRETWTVGTVEYSVVVGQNVLWNLIG